MVIEFLTFDVDPAIRERWLAADAASWTTFLGGCPGFVRKELWVDRDEPGRVHCVVTWTDEASWKSVPHDDLTRVDGLMGELVCAPTMRVFDVLGPIERHDDDAGHVVS